MKHTYDSFHTCGMTYDSLLEDGSAIWLGVAWFFHMRDMTHTCDITPSSVRYD